MNSTATSTIATAIASVVTATAKPKVTTPAYIDQALPTLSNMNIFILIATLIVIAVVGFNRMIAVPLIASIAGTIDNGLNWYVFTASHLYSLHARVAGVIVADICWGIQDSVLTFYSFFLLERILKGMQRKVFVTLFILLIVTIAGLRVGISTAHVKYWTINPTDAADPKAEAWKLWYHRLTRGYFGVVAALESMSATLLLKVFYTARRDARRNPQNFGSNSNLGLFAQLARSSEIRVATLVFVGITRATCFAFPDIRHNFDQVAYTLENAFTIFLLVDFLLTRLAKAQAIAEGREFGDSNASPERSGASYSTAGTAATAGGKRAGNYIGSGDGKGAVDSMRREFPGYIGKGWSRSASVPVEVIEAVEVSGIGVLDGTNNEKDIERGR